MRRHPSNPSPTVLWIVLTAFALGTPQTVPAADPPAAPTQPTAAPTTCGNGHLDPDETCAACPQDCVVHSCTPSGKTHAFKVYFDPPPTLKVSSITVRVGYDSRRISLPGSAGAESARARLGEVPKTAIVVTNDLDYALRAVVTQPGGIAAGQLFTLKIDGCKGARQPTAADFGCSLEGCAAATGHVPGCICRVTAN